MKNPKYNIGQGIYHRTPESPKGIVLDCDYSLLYDRWTYRVAFDIKDNETNYYEHELSNDKTY